MDHRERLVRFYTQCAPEKLGNVDAALKSFAGREDYMFQTLVKKYGPEPAAPAAPAAAAAAVPVAGAPTATDYRARLVRIFERYEPSKVNGVDKLLTAAQGREEELIAKLVARFGPEPPAAAGGAAAMPSVAPTPASESDAAWRARLTRYIQARAPEKLGTVDALLAKYKGREDEMMRALAPRLGPEPDAPSAAPDSSSQHRERLVRFYTQYAPEKLGNVDAALKSFAGREDYMFQTLVKKYGPEPAAPAAPAATAVPVAVAPAAMDYRARVERLIRAHAPEKLGTVDALLKRHEGREEEMMRALVKKLGPEPPAAATDAALPVSAAAPSSSSASESDAAWRARLTRYIQARAPEKLGTVDALLAKYKGREDEMMRALAPRLGPEPDAPSAAPAVAAAAPSTEAAVPASPSSTTTVVAFSPRSHVLSRIGTTAAQRLRASLAPLVAADGNDDLLFVVALAAEHCDFAAKSPEEAFRDYPRPPTDDDKRAFDLLRLVWTLRDEQTAAESELLAEEQRAMREIAVKRSADRDRVQQLLADRRRHHRLVVNRALELIGEVEGRMRHDIEERYRLEWQGQLQWFREQRDRVLTCSAPSQLKLLEEKMDRWKRMVAENDSELREWAAAKSRERRLAERCPELEYSSGSNNLRHKTWVAGSASGVGVGTGKGGAGRGGIAALGSSLRNVADELTERVRTYGTPASPHFPLTPRGGRAPSAASPTASSSPRAQTPRTARGLASPVLIMDSGKFVVSDGALALRTPRSGGGGDASAGALSVAATPRGARAWNQHVPRSSQPPIAAAVDHSAVRLPPRLEIPTTTATPFSFTTPRREASGRRSLDRL